MPYEDRVLRERLERRARKARDFGAVPDQRFPVTPEGTQDVPLRKEARFRDLSGHSIVGLFVTGTGTTGPNR